MNSVKFLFVALALCFTLSCGGEFDHRPESKGFLSSLDGDNRFVVYNVLTSETYIVVSMINSNHRNFRCTYIVGPQLVFGSKVKFEFADEEQTDFSCVENGNVHFHEDLTKHLRLASTE